MCGKLVASSMALYQLERSKAAEEEQQQQEEEEGGQEQDSKPLLQIPPSPKPKPSLTGTVNIILSYFSLENAPQGLVPSPLQQPFLSITIGGHSMETERSVLDLMSTLTYPHS